MPKYKSIGLRKQNGPRKRTGCITCKTAHVKCTEEKPHCRRCVRLRLACLYESKLLWEDDAEKQGIAHGRKGVWSKHGTKTITKQRPVESSLGEACASMASTRVSELESWDFVNHCVGDFVNGMPQSLIDEEQEAERLGETAEMWDVANTLQNHESTLFFGADREEAPSRQSYEDVDEEFDLPAYDDPLATPWTNISIAPTVPVFALTSTEAYLLDYYVSYLAPKCSLSTDLNPYLDVLLPIAYDFAPLRNTLLAASACQLFHLGRERTFEVQSLRYRLKAISGLNRHLGNSKMDWKSLATMVMFCFRDITDGCEPSWITHLQMGLRMLRELKCQTSTYANLRDFCEIYFVAHEVMGRTAWEAEDGELPVYGWGENVEYRVIDSIMGCSRELISLINQTSSLAVELQNGTSDHGEPNADLVKKAATILESLSSLQQVLRHGSANEVSMVQIAETKRLSAMLYLHNRILSQLPSFTIGNSLTIPLAYLQDTIIDALRMLPTNSGALLWPLFMLGKSNLHRADQVDFVLDRLAQLERSRYLGSVYHARRRVERDIRKRVEESHLEKSRQKKCNHHEEVMCENERWVSLA